ncbi:hypothetical protein [Marinococcus halophilus]|uniref:hypothetical protein n=1 Tax=Marinococcus halophilus TaxID=1371 RepID=UPI0009A6DCC4|nr:hypothetical protein [Marinococcus halophilus]
MDWRNEFKVIKRFRDKENESKVWEAGEPYTRTGEGKKARIEELAGKNNAAGEPLIQEVEPEQEEEGDS